MRRVFEDVLAGGIADRTGNLPPQPAIYPDYPAPILRHGADGGWQLVLARWGMPTPPRFLAGKRRDPGVTNIRNAGSPHWRRLVLERRPDWLQTPPRCAMEKVPA